MTPDDALSVLYGFAGEFRCDVEQVPAQVAHRCAQLKRYQDAESGRAKVAAEAQAACSALREVWAALRLRGRASPAGVDAAVVSVLRELSERLHDAQQEAVAWMIEAKAAQAALREVER